MQLFLLLHVGHNGSLCGHNNHNGQQILALFEDLMQTLCDNIINKNDPNIGAFIEALKELFNLFKWGIYKELLK